MMLSACIYKKPPEVKKNEVCFDDYCFDVELAMTLQDQQEGLMFRQSLEPTQGMLFIFPNNQRHGFWMKNTKIPLDILWLNENFRVVDMAVGAAPCQTDPCPSYYPQNLSRYVLEINAGVSQQWGINIGDKAEFKLLTSGHNRPQ